MPDALDHDRLIAALRELLACIPPDALGRPNLTTRRAKKLVAEIRGAIVRLRELSHAIDPIRQPPMILDPYQPEILGRLISETMMEQSNHNLETLHTFYGSGVYALYYTGDHEAYQPIRSTDTPVYAGKADPPTPLAETPEDQGPRLATRLREHAKSIRAARNLNIGDFRCRFLVVKSGLQKAAEDYLIDHFKPIWNQPICNGFGKHGDSPSKRSNTRSEWDTLHPGRPWATRDDNTPNPKPPEQIMGDIADHFLRYPPGA